MPFVSLDSLFLITELACEQKKREEMLVNKKKDHLIWQHKYHSSFSVTSCTHDGKNDFE